VTAPVAIAEIQKLSNSMHRFLTEKYLEI